MEMRRTSVVLGAVMAVLMFAMVRAGVALADTVFSTSSPTTKEDCKNGGYAKYGFKNQGQCIKAVNHATPADTTAPETTITAGQSSIRDLKMGLLPLSSLPVSQTARSSARLGVSRSVLLLRVRS
jgi:hypothetical protein